MKRFLREKSNRFGYDGWALTVKGAKYPMWFTVCTTRAEVRQVREEERNWMRKDIEIVKVRITVEKA